MSLGRRVVLGAAWGQAGYMVAFALATLLQIILARGLGTNQYGLYAAVNGIAYLALSIAAGGVMPTLNTHLSRMEHEYGRAGAAYLFWRLWAWRLIIFAGVGLAIVVFAKPLAAGLLGSSDESDLIVAGAFYLISIGLFQIVNMLFFGLLKTKWGALGNVLSAAANVGISTVLIWKGASLPVLFAGLAVGQIVVTLIQLLRAWPSVRLGSEVADLPRAARRDVASLWRFSTTVWMTGMLTYALGKQTDIFTMQILRTPQAEVGFYNLAVTLAISANTILLAGISNVALTGLSSLRAKAPEKLGQGWRTLCSVGPLLSVPVLVFTGVFAGPIVKALYGSAYDEVAVILQIYIAFVILAQVLGGGAHTTAFAALGIPRRTLQSRGVTGVANLIVNVPLIYFWGAKGAVVGTGVCGVVTIFYEYRLLTRHITERLPWADRGRAALAMIPGLIPAWFIAPHLGIIGVLIAGAVFLGCYAALLTRFKPLALDPDMLEAVPKLARRFVRLRPPAPPAGAAPAQVPAAR